MCFHNRTLILDFKKHQTLVQFLIFWCEKCFVLFFQEGEAFIDLLKIRSDYIGVFPVATLPVNRLTEMDL